MPATRTKSTAKDRRRATVNHQLHSSDVPSVRRVRRLPQIDELVIGTAGGRVRQRITADDCVFVVHRGMNLGETHADGHRYWKMKISSIHQGNGTVWAVGYWFYSPDHLEDVDLRKRDRELIPFLGNTELVFSDHVDVIDAACIEDKVHIHEFDDTHPSSRHITTSSWFVRLTLAVAQGTPRLGNVNLHCVCKKPYSPVLDRQRFCGECQKWFHERCMDRIGRPQQLRGDTAADQLMKVPVIRGWDRSPEAEDWMTAGSGRKVEAVKLRRANISAREMDIEEEWVRWEQILSQEFVQHVRTTKFIRFLCPCCSQHI